MHHIQQHILRTLILAEAERFSRLKPDGVDSNLFMYHLKAVMRERLVMKREDGLYTLTPAGQDYAERMSLTIMKPRFQPRVVTLICCQDTDGRYLMYRRARQPLYGMVSFPYGKVHMGEGIAAAAQRELADKAGLTAALEHRGDGYVTIFVGADVVSQIVFHLFVGTDIRGTLHTDEIPGVGSVGQAFWAHLDEVPTAELIPSVPDIITSLTEQVSGRFFTELTYHL